MDFIKGRLKELSTLDDAVVVGISLGVLLLGPMVKWMAWQNHSLILRYWV